MCPAVPWTRPHGDTGAGKGVSQVLWACRVTYGTWPRGSHITTAITLCAGHSVPAVCRECGATQPAVLLCWGPGVPVTAGCVVPRGAQPALGVV